MSLLSNEGVEIKWPLSLPAALMFYDSISQRHVNKPFGKIYIVFFTSVRQKQRYWAYLSMVKSEEISSLCCESP